MNITAEIYHKNQKVQNILKCRKESIFQKNCCYGYKKEDNTLKMDEPAADTVRLIFQLALQGNNYTQIVKELYNKKIVIPEIYKGEKRRKKQNAIILIFGQQQL